ncbi:DUF1566 domain-containing protein [Glaciecola siphonariae]|uniref:DUF1566 domain-containing protein n=1 Tax=Glaciecola siphonariae TaxID=521012 RepID=A0ABV9M1M2_9ALTE
MRGVMIKRLILVGCWALLAILSNVAIAESVCVGDIPATSDEELYLEIGDGQILHRPSNLVFMRCSLGQTWENDECTGEAALYTWQDALQASYGYEFAQALGWRMPNIKELSVIVERACVRPAVNEALFPQTPPDDFWTSTPSIIDDTRAWSMAFFNGTSSIKAKDRSLHVRLVRTRLNSE